jgi:hypothetical protein
MILAQDPFLSIRGYIVFQLPLQFYHHSCFCFSLVHNIHPSFESVHLEHFSYTMVPHIFPSLTLLVLTDEDRNFIKVRQLDLFINHQAF